MLIDWFTVGAQALNFIVLVWLLKHFLYKPITNAIDARENRIAAELADADRQKTEAQRARDEFLDKNKTFIEERDALMAKAVLEVKAERERLLSEARQEATDLSAKQQAAMRNDALALTRRLTRLAADEVFDIARKALNDLASASLEERLGEVFTRRLREMKPEAKESLAAALTTPNAGAVVRSRFDLGEKERATIKNAVNETFAADINLAFETAPDGICGIELSVSGQRLSWSIEEYLKTLETTAEAVLSADRKSTSRIPTPGGTVIALPVISVVPPSPPVQVFNGTPQARAS